MFIDNMPKSKFHHPVFFLKAALLFNQLLLIPSNMPGNVSRCFILKTGSQSPPKLAFNARPTHLPTDNVSKCVGHKN